MTETTATTPKAPETSATPAPDARWAHLEQQMADDAIRVYDHVRATARHLLQAADADDLEALGRAAYLTICDLAYEFTRLGTCLGLAHWRRIDPKRIDTITRLGATLRRDRPYPLDPAAIVRAEIDAPEHAGFWSKAPGTWSWHEREWYNLFLVGMLERPDVMERMERIPTPLREQDPALYAWLIAAARWVQDPRPIAEKGDLPPRPRSPEEQAEAPTT